MLAGGSGTRIGLTYEVIPGGSLDDLSDWQCGCTWSREFSGTGCSHARCAQRFLRRERARARRAVAEGHGRKVTVTR